VDEKVIIAIVSSIAGFAFTYILQAAKQRWNRREVLTDWFQQRYIIEGLDPLIAFCAEIQDLIGFQIGQYQQGYHSKEVSRWTLIYINQTTDGKGLALPQKAIGTIATLSKSTTLRSTLHLLSLPFWSLDRKVYNQKSLKQLDDIAREVEQALIEYRNVAFHFNVKKKSNIALFLPIDAFLEARMPIEKMQRVVRQLDAYKLDKPLASDGNESGSVDKNGGD